MAGSQPKSTAVHRSSNKLTLFLTYGWKKGLATKISPCILPHFALFLGPVNLLLFSAPTCLAVIGLAASSPFKGTVPRDFRLSTWISFPQVPNYTIRAVSNFFENSRRYSQLKVQQRQMEKIFNQKIFSLFLLDTFG